MQSMKGGTFSPNIIIAVRIGRLVAKRNPSLGRGQSCIGLITPMCSDLADFDKVVLSLQSLATDACKTEARPQLARNWRPNRDGHCHTITMGYCKSIGEVSQHRLLEELCRLRRFVVGPATLVPDG